ncbi:MAG: cell envelope integrity protein CreD [Treponema sp.]|nr:cell envelope integrity protein CreD [Treponema sp.]
MVKNKLLTEAGKIGAKPFIILVLVLLFLIPLSMLDSLIRDRKNYQREAVSSILQPKGGEPVVEGFALAVPYTINTEVIDKNGSTRYEKRTSYIVCTPEEWNANAVVETEHLTRGIFKVPVFIGKINSSGNFSKLEYSFNKINESDILWDECVLMIGVSNKKNLTKIPSISLNQNSGNNQNNSDNQKNLSHSLFSLENASPFTSTVFYEIDAQSVRNGFSFSSEIEIQGGKSFRIMPLAGNNSFTLESEWTTPGFSGGWLPVERNISENGFSAKWNIVGLSTVFPKMWITSQSTTSSDGKKFSQGAETVKIEFVTPVDNYQKTERSIKYALLFLLIPFIAIFIFEIFTKIKIHPVQYCLIGLADVIFYLLLLSVSEHLSFTLTYWISSMAVSLLLLFYASAIFKKIKWGAFFALVQVTAYIFLFGTLQAEDYALLIGSLGLFFVIALLMVLTRNIDWFASQSEKDFEQL